MFIVLQFPMYDSLYGAQSDWERSVPIKWPPAAAQHDPAPFLRSHGAAIIRRGAPPPGVEASSYDAHRALRFPPTPVRIERDHGAPLLPQCRFRRIVGDGTLDYRLEIGFTVEPPVRAAKNGAKSRVPHRRRWTRRGRGGSWEPTDVFDATRGLLQQESVVVATPGRKDVLPQAGRLVTQGDALAELLAASLQRTRAQPDPHRFRTGPPLVYIEANVDASREPLQSFEAVDIGQGADESPLLFRGQVFLGGGRSGRAIEVFLADASADPLMLRNLRLCLMRMHTTFWSLGLLFKDLLASRPRFALGTPQGNVLEGAVVSAISKLERGRFYGFRTSELQQAFMALWEGSWRSDRIRLEQRLAAWSAGLPKSLENARRNTTSKVIEWLGTMQRILGQSVFLSYAHSDLTVVAALEKELQSRGVNVWRDERYLLPGRPLGKGLRDAIRGQDYVFVCCTPRSLQSEWVLKEIAYALDRERWYRTHRGTEKPIVIPVLLDGSWEAWNTLFPDSPVAADAEGWESDPSKLERAADLLARVVSDYKNGR